MNKGRRKLRTEEEIRKAIILLQQEIDNEKENIEMLMHDNDGEFDISSTVKAATAENSIRQSIIKYLKWVLKENEI